MNTIHRCFTVLLLIATVTGCHSVSPFDQWAYEQATSIKVDALVVMEMATESFDDHRDDVKELKIATRKAYEYAKGRPKNESTVQQWEIMIDPEQACLFAFLNRWERDGSLKPAYVDEQKKMIAEGFDQIIELESGKERIE